jgi:Zn-dependent protease with chaperone function
VTEHLGEAAFQTFVAAVTAEALVRLWGLEDPGVRQRIRLIVVALPIVVWPLFELFLPFRHQPHFEDRYALAVGRRWHDVRMAGLALDEWWLALCVAMSLPAVLLDLVPLVRRLAAPGRPRGGSLPPPPELRSAADELCAATGTNPVRIAFATATQPIFYCRGVGAPTLVISRGAYEALDAGELRAALAHELGHIAHRDTLLGWGLLAARLLQPWNPALHVVARAIGRDAERRADDYAVAVTGDHLALASAILKLYRGSRRDSAVVARATEITIEDRCQRLLHHERREATLWRRTRVCAAGLAVLALAFLIT